MTLLQVRGCLIFDWLGPVSNFGLTRSSQPVWYTQNMADSVSFNWPHSLLGPLIVSSWLKKWLIYLKEKKATHATFITFLHRCYASLPSFTKKIDGVIFLPAKSTPLSQVSHIATSDLLQSSLRFFWNLFSDIGVLY